MKDNVLFLKKYFKEEKKLFFSSFILLFTSSLMGVLNGYLMGIAVEKISLGLFLKGIILFIILWLLYIIEITICRRFGLILISKFGNNIVEKIGYQVYEKVSVLPSYAFEEKSSGEFINRITSDASTISNAFQQFLGLSISLFTSLVVFIYILFNSVVVSLEVIIYLLLYYLISKKYLPFIKERQESITKKKDYAVSYVGEAVRGIREIRALGIRKKINKNFKRVLHGTFMDMNEQIEYEKNYSAFIEGLDSSLEIVVYITCIILIINGSSSFAFFMSMTYFISRFMFTIEQMTSMATSYEKMKVSLKRIREILDNKLYQDENYGNIVKKELKGNIEFRDVTFKYPNEDKNTLSNFNISIESGKKIAIVGKSGQGKTTIFNLILRYFEPSKGSIYLDNEKIEDYSEKFLRKNIAIIRQEPFIFNKTIKENLVMVQDKIDMKRVIDACKRAEIHEYIMSLQKSMIL